MINATAQRGDASEPGAPVRLLVVDDHPIVRSGLAGLISTDPRLELVGSVSSGEQALVAVTERVVDVVLMDLRLGGMDGVEATRRLLEIAPEVEVLVLTTSSDRDDILRAFDAGACGYILKDADPAELVQAIHAAMRGESPMAWRTARTLVDSRTPEGAGDAVSSPSNGTEPVDVQHLTAREREVLLLLRDGLTNRDIAQRLGISESTVKAHLKVNVRGVCCGVRTASVELRPEVVGEAPRPVRVEANADCPGHGVLTVEADETPSISRDKFGGPIPSPSKPGRWVFELSAGDYVVQRGREARRTAGEPPRVVRVRLEVGGSETVSLR